MRLLRPFLCVALVLAATLSAQQGAPLDAKTQQQYERLLRHRYTRDLTEVFAAMEKSAKADARATAEGSRLMRELSVAQQARLAPTNRRADAARRCQRDRTHRFRMRGAAGSFIRTVRFPVATVATSVTGASARRGAASAAARTWAPST
jgi:hypothetical protein